MTRGTHTQRDLPAPTGMDSSARKEEFSLAYFRAVCACAGFSVGKPSVDDDSVDAQISASRKFHPRAPRLEAQLKCRTGIVLRDDDFSVPISRKNYDDLRADVHVPRILIVVRVPDAYEDWLIQSSEDTALLRYCGYWTALRGAPDPADSTQDTVSVRINRANVFTAAALTGLMLTIGRGGAL